mmetsp:Transcript_11855/g.28759  ORF Transcript_11855/g.28759 Transcript_11855/m.28759 type:complete len:234 (-) Transcript_11855:290-991(-)
MLDTTRLPPRRSKSVLKVLAEGDSLVIHLENCSKERSSLPAFTSLYGSWKMSIRACSTHAAAISFSVRSIFWSRSVRRNFPPVSLETTLKREVSECPSSCLVTLPSPLRSQNWKSARILILASFELMASRASDHSSKSTAPLLSLSNTLKRVFAVSASSIPRFARTIANPSGPSSEPLSFEFFGCFSLTVIHASWSLTGSMAVLPSFLSAPSHSISTSLTMASSSPFQSHESL